MPYIVPLPVRISEMSALENSKPFSPGHVYLNQSKQAFFLFEIFAPPWQRDYAPSGTSRWYLLIWSFATATLKAMFSKYHLIWPSSSFWRNTDLNGASGNTITSNLPYWYLVLHNLLYCDFVVIKSAKVLSCRDFMQNPDCRWKKTVQLSQWLQLILPRYSCFFYHGIFDALPLTHDIFVCTWLGIASLSTLWTFLFPQLLGFH